MSRTRLRPPLTLDPPRPGRRSHAWVASLALSTLLAAGCEPATKVWNQLALPEPDQPIARGAPRPMLTPKVAPTPAADALSGTSAPPGKAGTKGKAGQDSKPAASAKKPLSEAAKRKAAKAAARKAARLRARKVIPLEMLTLAKDRVRGIPPRTKYPLLAVFARIRQIASVGEVRHLLPWTTRATREHIARNHKDSPIMPIAPRTLWHRLRGDLLQLEYAGQRAMLSLKQPQGVRKLTFYVEAGSWRLDLTDVDGSAGAKPLPPQVSLAEATKGITGRGPLVAVFHTPLGRFRCRLHEGRAADTVAHFVGLARGLIGPVHTGGRIRRFYDGLRFHAAVPGKLIQGGDPTETGTGGAGVTIRDEFDPKLRHDRAGVLSLASAGPHTGSSQFFVTLVPAPRLDDRHAIFGQCRDLKVVRAIAARAPRTVVLDKVTIQRDF